MNSDININYTRAKKRNWSKCWLYTCWLSAGFAIAFWAFLKGNILNPFQFILITMLYTTGILILCVVTALRIYRLRHRIQPDDQTDVLNDEDAYWIMGMFYYNPNSKRTMVEKRVGIGTTVNMATKAGKILTFIGALSILLIPVCCVWLMFEEFTPIHVKLSDGEVISEQWKEEYTIPLKEIEEVTLLTELPDTSKISGSGLENLKKGTFSVKGYGDCELLLNPKNEVFLVIKTDKDTYIFSDTEDKGTKELYDEIAIGKSR